MKPFIYTSEDYGAPQLQNQWGDLAKLLKTVLVTGFGDIESCTANRIANDTLEITLGIEADIQIEGIIFLKGVTGHENTRLHVKSRPGPKKIIVKNYEGIDLSAFAVGNVICTVTRKPLGYTALYDDIENSGKIVFTNRNGWNLRVHDEFPKENTIWQSTWSKAARISYGRGMVNIDTWAGQPKNLNPARPDSWKEPHYVGSASDSNVKISENAWYYAVHRDSLSAYVYSSLDDNNTQKYHWTIIGTDTTFYLYINVGQNQSYTCAQHCYGFGEFDSLISNDINNAFIISWNAIGGTSVFGDTYNFKWQSVSVTNTIIDDYSYKQLNIAAPASQLTPNYIPFASLTWLKYSNLGNSHSGYSNSFNQASNDIGTLMYSPAYLEEYLYQLRGTMKGAKIILNDVRTLILSTVYSGQFLTVNAYNINGATDDKRYILKPHMYYYFEPDNSIVTVMFNTYEDWD